MPLVAVDQVYRPVNATIQGYPNSVHNDLLLGQVTKIPDKCTNITFQVISSQPSEELILFAKGPCKDAELSKLSYPALVQLASYHHIIVMLFVGVSVIFKSGHLY